jgi:photosystem II stability/assembly factor-like uncharacterized protein
MTFIFLWLLISMASPLHAEDGGNNGDIDYAELQPLATESLLLDIVATPSGRLVAVGERGHVVLSDDGETWHQAKVVPTRSTLTTVTTEGGRLWAAGHDAVIITSGDGGETWTRQYYDPERQQAFMDIEFTDGENGIAMGSYGLFMVTDDGGENWLDEYVDEENEYHLNDMVRLADDERLIAGEAGFSYRSFDGGQTWEALDLPYIGSMWGAQKVGEGCVLFFGLRGHILESCDLGESWTELNADTLSSLSGAAYDAGKTIIVGNSGAVLVREGNGPFELMVHSSGVDFGSVLALGNGHFILVGEDGVHRFPEPQGEGDAESGATDG